MLNMLRLPKWAGCCLLVATSTIGVGCSATNMARFRVAEGSRSVASIGGRQLPPSVGPAGAQVSPETARPEPIRSSRARISGRVVDADGRAVAGAVVRLADGSSQAGRDVQSVTDASGAFTLGNLRPGSSYQLLAEADFGADSGPLVGHAQADTAEKGVQIRLGDDDPPAVASRQGRDPKARTRAISERTQGTDAGALAAGVNAEDIGPPPEAADEVNSAPRATGRLRPDHAEPGPAESSSAWHRPGLDADLRPTATSSAPDDTDEPLDLDQVDPGAGRHRPTGAAEPDAENPLPPALPAKARTSAGGDRPATRASRLPRAHLVEPDPAADSAGVEPGELALTDRTEDHNVPPSEPGTSPTSGSLLAMPSIAELTASAAADPPPKPAPPVNLAASSSPPASLEANPVVEPASTSPATAAPGSVFFEPNPGGESLAGSGQVVDPSANYNPFALIASAEPPLADSATTEPPVPSLPPRPAAPQPADRGEVGRTAGGMTATDDEVAAQPKKWGDIAPAASAAALGAGLGSGATAAALNLKNVSTHSNRPNALLTRRSKLALPKADAPALCQFDSQTNRLVDFQLPDLAGQPVRFHDLDADYILLDFWGTWCAPCMASIPHLINLQKTYGPTRLQVVGIACEQVPAEKRRAIVAAASEKLGITYSVLVANRDDGPVQAAFQVQNYPTMVLLDRRGKILFRAVGATERNMSRLDKALAAAQKSTQVARR